jgi:hypothetical protein
MADRCRNTLSIRERGKFVPYCDPAHKDRGFKNLKSRPDSIATLVGLDHDPALLAVVAAINASGTRLFSVACRSHEDHLERGHRSSGYVEFAWNSQAAVQDAASYFPLFQRFGRWLHFHRFEAAWFEWELEETEFLDAAVSGFTCAVFLKTGLLESATKARHDWEQALRILGHFLGACRGTEDEPIYEPSVAHPAHGGLDLDLDLSAARMGLPRGGQIP